MSLALNNWAQTNIFYIFEKTWFVGTHQERLGLFVCVEVLWPSIVHILSPETALLEPAEGR